MTREMATDQWRADVDQKIGALTGRIAGVESKLDTQGSKLDTLIAVVTRMDANKPMPILEAIKFGLSILQSLTFLFGATAAGIIYLSSNSNNVDIALLKERLQQVQERVNWQATVKR